MEKKVYQQPQTCTLFVASKVTLLSDSSVNGTISDDECNGNAGARGGSSKWDADDDEW